MGLMSSKTSNTEGQSVPHSKADGEPGFKFSVLCLIMTPKRLKLARVCGCGLSVFVTVRMERDPRPGRARTQDAL